MTLIARSLLAGSFGLALAACQQFELTPEPAQAEWDKGAMVAAADPRAVEAGLEVLRNGGHAVDAAIAVHAVLGLVEPQSSGLGGGAFMVVYDRASGETLVYDGRETAPLSATEDLFVVNDKALGFLQAWQTGRATGVPGVVSLYETAYEAHGQAEWSALFQSAIDLASEGFEVSPRLAEVLANDRLRQVIRLDDNPVSADYFYPGGEPLSAGWLLSVSVLPSSLRAGWNATDAGAITDETEFQWDNYRALGDYTVAVSSERSALLATPAEPMEPAVATRTRAGVFENFANVAEVFGYVGVERSSTFLDGSGEDPAVEIAAGLADPRRTVGAAWFDMDKDGDFDLFLANQSGDRDGDYRNDRGQFVDIASSLGMDRPGRALVDGSVGVSVCDFNNDGHFDMYVPS